MPNPTFDLDDRENNKGYWPTTFGKIPGEIDKVDQVE